MTNVNGDSLELYTRIDEQMMWNNLLFHNEVASIRINMAALAVAEDNLLQLANLDTSMMIVRN